eukprot:SAG31_NODE_1973_length_6757_cov_1.653950_2_plen_117_part_00
MEVVKCGHKGFVARPEPETTTQEVSPETRLRHLVEFFLEEGWVFEDKLKQLRKQLPSRDFDDRLQQWLGEAAGGRLSGEEELTMAEKVKRRAALMVVRNGTIAALDVPFAFMIAIM